MNKHKIALIPGDGVGPEVIAEGVKVLKKVAELDGSFSFDFTEFPWGCRYYLENGRMMAEDGMEQLAAIWSASQMLDFLGHEDWGRRVLQSGGRRYHRQSNQSLQINEVKKRYVLSKNSLPVLQAVLSLRTQHPSSATLLSGRTPPSGTAQFSEQTPIPLPSVKTATFRTTWSSTPTKNTPSPSAKTYQ